MNKYDYGIYRGVSYNYDYKDKGRNLNDYINYTLLRSLSMFKYHNLPETIPEKELELMLQTQGFSFITEFEHELYAFTGGLGGEPDEYYRPTQIIISNPNLKFNESLDLKKDGVLIGNDDLRMGLIPLFSRYCNILVENDITMIMTVYNKRILDIITANDDATLESAKAYIKQVIDGKQSVIMNNRLYESIHTLATGSGQDVSLNELFEFHQYIKASLYNEIGLNANNNMKKERLIQEEQLYNSDVLYPLIDNMYSNRVEAIEQVNEMFGTNIEVEFNSSWDYRVYQGEPIDTKGMDSSNDEPIDGSIYEEKEEEQEEEQEEEKEEAKEEEKEEDKVGSEE